MEAVESNPERFGDFFAPLVEAIATRAPAYAAAPDGVCGIALLTASGQVSAARALSDGANAGVQLLQKCSLCRSTVERRFHRTHADQRALG